MFLSYPSCLSCQKTAFEFFRGEKMQLAIADLWFEYIYPNEDLKFFLYCAGVVSNNFIN
jgi:hypothetical protein